MSERLPDRVMLDDFERFLEISWDNPDKMTEAQQMGFLLDMGKFLDENGRRLLLLAKTCVFALERQRRGAP